MATTEQIARPQPVTVPEPESRPAGFWDGVAHSYIPPETLHIGGDLQLHRDMDADVDPITRR
jgi:hypothetical protein